MPGAPLLGKGGGSLGGSCGRVGGVRASTAGRSGSLGTARGVVLARPFALGSESGLPWVIGEDSAERPRMIPSSTSRFLASIAFLRFERRVCCSSSLAREVLLA